jgi:hypothetical protein
MSNLLTFPHNALSASKTAKAGVLTVNDLIHEDSYGIMTRDTGTENASHTAAVYSFDNDTNSLIERSRTTNELDSVGNTHLSIGLTKTDGASATMQPVLTSNAQSTKIISGGVGASFSVGGLMWDDASAALYIGGNQFRLRFVANDPQNGGLPTLLTEGLCSDGSYKAKAAVVNDC